MWPFLIMAALFGFGVGVDRRIQSRIRSWRERERRSRLRHPTARPRPEDWKVRTVSMKRPPTLRGAIQVIMGEATEPMSAPMVLDAIRTKYGSDAFWLCSWLDVYDAMTEIYGEPPAP